MESTTRTRRVVKVAVIGSGLAGLTAAYRLSTLGDGREDIQFEVHLFEKSANMGMDSHSISVPMLDTGGKPTETLRVDVPMRAFLGGYYPHLIRLYKHLGVEFRRTDFTYSLSTLSFQGLKRVLKTDVIYNGNSGLAGVSMPSALNSSEGVFHLLAIFMFTATSLMTLFNYIRLLFHCSPLFRLPDMTYREWIERTTPRTPMARWAGLDDSWRDFCSHFVLPLFSAICTASRDDIMAHPVHDIFDCIWAALFDHHYVAAKNVQDVVSRISRPIHHIHRLSPVSSIIPDPNDSCRISLAVNGGRETYHDFSHIIFATQANAVSPLLAPYLAALPRYATQRQHIQDAISCLNTFQYRPTIIINHTDDSVLPEDRQDWRDVNLIDASEAASYPITKNKLSMDSGYIMATQILPRPSSNTSSSPVVFQTTNPIISPRVETILSVSHLERAVLTLDTKKALQGLETVEAAKWWQSYAKTKTSLGGLQGCGALEDKSLPGIWFCGSYASTGIPLLEGCVISAKNVVDQGIFVREGVRTISSKW